jgi:hypothetical protein
VTEKDKALLNGNEESTIEPTKHRDLNEMEENSDVEPDDSEDSDEDSETSALAISKKKRLNQTIEFDKDTSIAMEDDTTVNIHLLWRSLNFDGK